MCLEGMVRVVVLDRETRRDVHRGHRRRQSRRDLRPRHARARLRGADRLPLPLPRHRGVRRCRPRRARSLLERRARQASVEHGRADPVGARPSRVLITGAAGQLGTALAESFPDARALTRTDWDVTQPPPTLERPDLVLHAAAWTDVDGAEDDPQGAAAANVGGTAHAASLGAPLVLFSTDYVFDGAKREPYVESDAPNPLSAYGRTKLHGEAAAGEEAWIVRTSGLFGWTSRNFVRTMLRLGRRAGRGIGRRRSANRADVRRPPRRRVAAGARAAVRDLPRRRVRRLHVGRVRARRSSTRRACPAACARSRARSGAHGRNGRRTRSCAAKRPARRACRTGAWDCERAWIGSKEALTEEISRRRQQVRQQASARMLRVRAGDQFAVAVGVGCAAKRSCAVVPVTLPLVGGPLGTSARLRPLERLQPSGAWMSAMPESVSASPSSRMLIVARRSGYGR